MCYNVQRDVAWIRFGEPMIIEVHWRDNYLSVKCEVY